MLSRQLRLNDKFSGASLYHFLRVAQLMTIRGSTKGNENCRPARCRNFGGGNCSRAANNQIGPCKALGHVAEEWHNFGIEFAARISGSNRIVVALAGLVHNTQFILASSKEIHGIDECSIDEKRPLAASGY